MHMHMNKQEERQEIKLNENTSSSHCIVKGNRNLHEPYMYHHIL